jgi:aminotransferase
VFSREELEFIRDLCVRWSAFAVTDEIYEHIIYDGAEHISMASLDGMRNRTVTISGMSKTYSVTGWRVGWAIAPPEASVPIRKVHDFLTVGAPAPLQQAGAQALELPSSYYQKLAENYQTKRDRMLGILTAAGFQCFKPQGAYYIMTDISRFGYPDDISFARFLVEKAGIAVVPGSSFYDDPASGARQVRFTFCKKESTLAAAAEKLSKLHPA